MKTKIKLLWNPYERIAGWKAFFIGLAVVVVSVCMAYAFGDRFAGITNATFVKNMQLWEAMARHLADLLVLAVLMTAAAKILAKGVRVQDMLGVVFLSRIPYFFLAFRGAIVSNREIMEIADIATNPEAMQEMIPVLVRVSILGVLALVMLVWMVALLYNGYMVSSGLKGARCVVSFIAVLVLTQVITTFVGMKL